MLINIISLFPEMFEGPFSCSMLKRAKHNKHINIEIINVRDFTTDKHRVVDDYSYGGGSGMVMKIEPFFRAAESLLLKNCFNKYKIILMCPDGEIFDQQKAKELALYEHLIIMCGHYEGIDERVRSYLVDETISIGNYVLTGGELPAMVVSDAVVRMLPGVLGTADCYKNDSFYYELLDYPHYTRPHQYNGLFVPEVLLSGNHEKIALWRKEQSLKNTLLRRPELLDKIKFSKIEKELLRKIISELESD